MDSASFSPDGTRIVTASWDKTARIWDAATGNQLTILSGHEKGVNTASFSPDGTRIVTASNSFSRYGTRFLTASWDSTVRIWDAASGSQLFVLLGHEKGVDSASFSPDGTRIVTTSLDDTVRIWDAATGQQLIVIRGHQEGHENWVSSASFSPDGTRIVSKYHGAIRIWDSVPYAQRYRQKQAYEKAKPIAARVLDLAMAAAPQRDGGPDLRAVAKSIRTDPGIDETVRHVAINLLMRRADQIRSKAQTLKKESAETQEVSSKAKNEGKTKLPATAQPASRPVFNRRRSRGDWVGV